MWRKKKQVSLVPTLIIAGLILLATANTSTAKTSSLSLHSSATPPNPRSCTDCTSKIESSLNKYCLILGNYTNYQTYNEYNYTTIYNLNATNGTSKMCKEAHYGFLFEFWNVTTDKRISEYLMAVYDLTTDKSTENFTKLTSTTVPLYNAGNKNYTLSYNGKKWKQSNSVNEEDNNTPGFCYDKQQNSYTDSGSGYTLWSICLNETNTIQVINAEKVAGATPGAIGGVLLLICAGGGIESEGAACAPAGILGAITGIAALGVAYLEYVNGESNGRGITLAGTDIQVCYIDLPFWKWGCTTLFSPIFDIAPNDLEL
jgi:hypothetical protein